MVFIFFDAGFAESTQGGVYRRGAYLAPVHSDQKSSSFIQSNLGPPLRAADCRSTGDVAAKGERANGRVLLSLCQWEHTS